MGFIKEPKGVDLIIGPSVLTEQDKKKISEIIANYKLSGKLPAKTIRTAHSGQGTTKTKKKKVLA